MVSLKVVEGNYFVALSTRIPFTHFAECNRKYVWKYVFQEDTLSVKLKPSNLAFKTRMISWNGNLEDYANED